MRNNPDTLPYNPFVEEPDLEEFDTETAGTVKVFADQVGYCAEGFERLADESDWAEPELQVLRDAAIFIRWTAEQNGISENQAISNRANAANGMLTLVYGREITDENR